MHLSPEQRREALKVRAAVEALNTALDDAATQGVTYEAHVEYSVRTADAETVGFPQFELRLQTREENTAHILTHREE